MIEIPQLDKSESKAPIKLMKNKNNQEMNFSNSKQKK